MGAYKIAVGIVCEIVINHASAGKNFDVSAEKGRHFSHTPQWGSELVCAGFLLGHSTCVAHVHLKLGTVSRSFHPDSKLE